MKRILCLWLSQWPIQRLRGARPELDRQSLVLFTTAARGKKIVVFCSSEAMQRGLTLGMPLAEAKALAGPQSPIRFEPYDPHADRAALRQLALACQQFGPYAAMEEAELPECLLVDVTGCGPIFGGEMRLAEEAVKMLRERGYVARAAIADTIGASWALAHSAVNLLRELTCPPHPRPLSPEAGARGQIAVIPPGAHPEALHSLPIETLRLSAATIELLYSLDLRRIGQLLELPRTELPARFGPELVLRLDQALGRLPELLTPEKDAEPIEASWELDYPSSDRRVLEKVLQHLLDQVLAKLQPRGLGVHRLLATLRMMKPPSPPAPLPRSGGEGSGSEPVYLQVGLLQPSASAGHLFELLRLQSERLQLTAEVASIRLRVLQAVPLEFRQRHIFADDACQRQREQFPALVERLSHRLGEQAVLHPRLHPDVQPELAWRYEPWLRRERQSDKVTRRQGDKVTGRRLTLSLSPCHPVTSSPCHPHSRPPCLKTRPLRVPVMSVVPDGPPVRFEWKNTSHVVARWWGPERIETGWWRGRDVRRDYYLVETTGGARFWLFRAIEERTWFLHGND
jgi:protein ImuB